MSDPISLRLGKLDEVIEALGPKIETQQGLVRQAMQPGGDPAILTFEMNVLDSLVTKEKTLIEHRGALQAQLAPADLRALEERLAMQAKQAQQAAEARQSQAQQAAEARQSQAQQAAEARQSQAQQAMEASMRRLLLQQSTTITTLAGIGKEWMSKANKIRYHDLPFWDTSTKRMDDVASCETSVKKLFEHQQAEGRVFKQGKTERTLPGLSLTDASGHHKLGEVLREDTGSTSPLDMQKLVMKVIREVHHDVCMDVHLMETNDKSRELHHPTSRPDLTTVAEKAAQATWSQVVGFWEWKLKPIQQTEVFGQLIQRCSTLLDQQRHQGRDVIYAVGMTMDSLLVMEVKPGSNPEEPLEVRHTEWQSFSICRDSVGFQLLVQVLAAKKDLLGYKPATFPSCGGFSTKQGLVEVQFQGILKDRTKKGDSFVFLVSAAGCDAVVKLNTSTRERECLQRLDSLDNIVPLRAYQRCQYLTEEWEAILLGVWVERLTCEDTLVDVAQVTFDVAGALEGAAKLGVLHRDVTPSNLGVVKKRGQLLDWSAGKMFDIEKGMDAERSEGGAPLAITGTMLYCPYPILCGEQHSISSQLDALFISMLSISCDGEVYGRKLRSDQVQHWTDTRLGQFANGLRDEPHIAQHLKPFLLDLFALFWHPMGPHSQHVYVQKPITTEQFQAVCMTYGAKDL